MIYRIVGRFSNTELAQTAAKRTTETVPDVFEVRLYYKTREEESGIFNNIRYAQAVNSVLPRMSPDSTSSEYSEEEMTYPLSEMSEESLVSVITSEKYVDTVRKIFYNCGGFDVTQTIASD